MVMGELERHYVDLTTGIYNFERNSLEYYTLLKRRNGKSINEIAESKGVPIDTIKQTIDIINKKGYDHGMPPFRDLVLNERLKYSIITIIDRLNNNGQFWDRDIGVLQFYFETLRNHIELNEKAISKIESVFYTKKDDLDEQSISELKEAFFNLRELKVFDIYINEKDLVKDVKEELRNLEDVFLGEEIMKHTYRLISESKAEPIKAVLDLYQRMCKGSTMKESELINIYFLAAPYEKEEEEHWSDLTFKLFNYNKHSFGDIANLFDSITNFLVAEKQEIQKGFTAKDYLDLLQSQKRERIEKYKNLEGK